ncbi:integrase arm-type DNA-binding domain-containing protein [Acuticoccus sp. MNP-M23]|uniref:integrase arm-type DNA-binding domain-containing protein n=1 Tax=Acuticoccus sp. MNP-M23 TaxID=3072793 RepID=UPI0028162FDD|nr:integrase arm-type DNA-binding domain-containing protein [Acuticoccus sp. MNP-M23]WMS42296.1 integrase arm-type DNA-binding domain-containing protein [Acuticoccus sp. MNP-M23]
MKFTKDAIEALPFAEQGQVIVRHEEEPGFFLVVGKRTKTFTVQVDTIDRLGRRVTRKKTLGRHPQITVADARRAARAARVELAEASAPKTRRLTLGGALDELFAGLDADVAAGRRSTNTVTYYRWGAGILADWRDVPLARLSENPAEVRQRHAEVAAARGQSAARAAVVTLRRAYNLAFRQRLDPELPAYNPAMAVRLDAPQRRSTALDGAALPAWFAQLDRLDNPLRRAFHALTLLTGSRPGALAEARWEHIDLARRTLFIPRPKGGERRAFKVPLSREASRCLILARRAGAVLFPGSPWIFPAQSKSGHIEEWREDRNTLSHWGNDLRQSFRTFAATAGVPKTDSMALMNHAFGDVHDGYLTLRAMTHLRAEQQRISTHVRRLGGDPQLLRDKGAPLPSTARTRR